MTKEMFVSSCKPGTDPKSPETEDKGFLGHYWARPFCCAPALGEERGINKLCVTQLCEGTWRCPCRAKQTGSFALPVLAGWRLRWGSRPCWVTSCRPTSCSEVPAAAGASLELLGALPGDGQPCWDFLPKAQAELSHTCCSTNLPTPLLGPHPLSCLLDIPRENLQTPSLLVYLRESPLERY